MGYQFGQASLVSPPTPDFGTGAALDRPLLQAPAMYAWGDAKPLFDRRTGFRTCLPSGVGNLSGWRETFLVLRYFSPPLGATSRRSWLYKMAAPPSGARRGTINDGSAGYLRRYGLNKTGPEVPDKVGSAGECGFTRACAHLRGQDRQPLWSPQVGVNSSKKPDAGFEPCTELSF